MVLIAYLQFVEGTNPPLLLTFTSIRHRLAVTMVAPMSGKLGKRPSSPEGAVRTLLTSDRFRGLGKGLVRHFSIKHPQTNGGDVSENKPDWNKINTDSHESNETTIYSKDLISEDERGLVFPPKDVHKD